MENALLRSAVIKSTFIDYSAGRDQNKDERRPRKMHQNSPWISDNTCYQRAKRPPHSEKTRVG